MSEDAIESLRQHQRKMEEAVRTFKMAGVDIKLVSGDDELSALTDKACELGIYSVGSTDEAVEGQHIRNLCADELKRRADRIKVMAKFLPKDKLSVVQCLKEKGHVVAFYGAQQQGMHWFIQLQLTVMVSSLVITSVATMALGESPITLIQLIWVNLVTSILGGLMLIMEPQIQEPHTLQAAGEAILGINRRVIKSHDFQIVRPVPSPSTMSMPWNLEKKWSGGVKQKGLPTGCGGAAVAVQVLVAENLGEVELGAVGFLFPHCCPFMGLGVGHESSFTLHDQLSISKVAVEHELELLDLSQNLLTGFDQLPAVLP
ncbi:Calcium-transporting ATPase 12, plasma membrane-type [Vitis vinifera]|uniref:Calcium-transporting ATPase 12, plasma membrane-type n=1 Tax=Vitis vinifera TaxID=29760 RepID=A0A438DQ77_VITVI|nr:Calcium-transporting ATPase 12, plasma membrane-type [Vitis vinifera]